jgi:hypothetical protein
MPGRRADPHDRLDLGRRRLTAVSAGLDLDLDSWIPEPQVRTRHRRRAAASADRLWEAAGGVRVCDTRALGRAVRWRIPGTPADITFRELFRCYPFIVLAEGERWSISGLCGRIWTIRRDYPRIADSEEFAGWDEPGTVRVMLAHWIEPEGDGRAALVSESRVEPIDRGAQVRLRALWALVGQFDRLVGGEALGVAARRAERDPG